MANYIDNPLYLSACESYTESKRLIGEISKVITGIDPSITYEEVRIQYDLILQAVLLNAALEDGKFEDIELEFVTLLIKYGDILALANEACKKLMPEWKDVRWANISALDSTSAKKLAEIVTKIVSAYTDAFVKVFYVIDRANQKVNYLDELTSYTRRILSNLSKIDGDKKDSETITGMRIFNELVTNKCKK